MLSTTTGAASIHQLTNRAPAIHATSDENSSASVVVSPVVPDGYLPYEEIHDPELLGLTDGTAFHCVHRGMQPKCLFTNLIVHRNTFYVYPGQIHTKRRAGDERIRSSGVTSDALELPRLLRGEGQVMRPVASHGGDGLPDPIYPADGQVGPLAQYHKYRGHRLHRMPTHMSDWRGGGDKRRSDQEGHTGWPCSRVVTQPTLFLFRMSGHSTYHMWENNLGPFFATLQDSFDLQASSSAVLKAVINDPSRLLVAFVDLKPRDGPKAPHLLDQMLRSFSSRPLLNASMISEPTCFSTAIVGVSASSFPHRALIQRMLRNFIGLAEGPRRVLPAEPRCLFISRNHPKVIRGRKIMNEGEVLAALNATVLRETGAPLRVVHMEDFSYRDQVALAAGTNIIFSPHGGGVANCIWMTPGSVMVEFVAPVGKTLPGMYHSMCGNSGITHFHFLADPDPADAGLTDNPRLFSNMRIPPERMVENGLKALRIYKENAQRSATNRKS
jgi:hypothetical protein